MKRWETIVFVSFFFFFLKVLIKAKKKKQKNTKYKIYQNLTILLNFLSTLKIILLKLLCGKAAQTSRQYSQMSQVSILRKLWLRVNSIHLITFHYDKDSKNQDHKVTQLLSHISFRNTKIKSKEKLKGIWKLLFFFLLY
jgi:uncharacterized membrane protein